MLLEISSLSVAQQGIVRSALLGVSPDKNTASTVEPHESVFRKTESMQGSSDGTPRHHFQDESIEYQLSAEQPRDAPPPTTRACTLSPVHDS